MQGRPRRGVTPRSLLIGPRQCLCFFGSCRIIVTLSAEDQETVNAPCEVCDVDGDPEQMMLLRIFNDTFAAEWEVAFGESHYATCTKGEWHNAEKGRDFGAKDGLLHGRWPMRAVTKNLRGESIQIRFLGPLVKDLTNILSVVQGEKKFLLACRRVGRSYEV
ncbi:A/G-specific adenine glycosylase [Colletotrichum scovillei]|nr:A/G-specific adenine glycosylase [Colletotrichum scovillei]